MKTAEVELYCDDVNGVILKTPGRSFPGYVMQGDQLSVLYRRAKNIHKLSKDLDNREELIAEASNLFKSLDHMIRHYEAVLDSNGFQIPYSPDVVLQDITDWRLKD